MPCGINFAHGIDVTASGITIDSDGIFVIACDNHVGCFCYGKVNDVILISVSANNSDVMLVAYPATSITVFKGQKLKIQRQETVTEHDVARFYPYAYK